MYAVTWNLVVNVMCDILYLRMDQGMLVVQLVHVIGDMGRRQYVLKMWPGRGMCVRQWVHIVTRKLVDLVLNVMN